MDTNPKIVAVAEDDPDDRVLIRDAFQQCGWNVQLEYFADGSSLLDFLHLRKDYALTEKRTRMILMDMFLPGTNAFELITAIKCDSSLRRIPLIVLAGYCRETDVLECYDAGANTVINKPDTFGELLQSVKRMCDYWFGFARA